MRFLFIVFVACGVLQSCNYNRNSEYDFPKSEVFNADHEHLAALSILSDDIKNNPSDPSSYFKRAKLHLQIENYQDALVDISRAEKLNPNSGEYLYYKAKIQDYLGQKEALSNAMAAESQNYDMPDLYVLIADLLLKTNQTEKARQYLEKAESLYPHLSELFLVRGRLYAKNGDTLTAINNLKKSINLKPHEFRPYDDLTKLYASYRWIDSSIHVNDAAIARFPNKKELVYNKGLILEKVGNGEGARLAYLEFLKIMPERFDILGRIGSIYYRKRQFDDARVMFLKWSKLDPEKPDPLVRISETFEKQADYYNAKKYVDLALKITPDDNKLKLLSSNYEYRLSEQSEAVTEYKASKPAAPKAEPVEVQEAPRRIFGEKIEILQKRSTIKIGRDSTRN